MRLKTLFVVSSVAALALLVTAVALAAEGKSKHSTASVKITTRSVSGLGKILVNSQGRTLYMFVPDKHKSVTCHGQCAKIWPPVFLPAGGKIVAAGGVKQALLSSDKDSTGGRVVTYNHWPLYLYLGDPKAGAVSGQALNVNGGLWYVMSPTGAIIKKKPGGGGTGTTATGTGTQTTACSDDDGDGDESAGGPDDGDGCI